MPPTLSYRHKRPGYGEASRGYNCCVCVGHGQTVPIKHDLGIFTLMITFDVPKYGVSDNENGDDSVMTKL